MHKARPYYLDLFRIRLPVGGFVSILHRLSGAALAFLVPPALYALMLSLESQAGFERIAAIFSGGPGWLIGLGLVWALLHHLLAGLRHLGFDLGWGEDRQRARQTAWVSLGGAVVLALALWGGT